MVVGFAQLPQETPPGHRAERQVTIGHSSTTRPTASAAPPGVRQRLTPSTSMRSNALVHSSELIFCDKHSAVCLPLYEVLDPLTTNQMNLLNPLREEPLFPFYGEVNGNMERLSYFPKASKDSGLCVYHKASRPPLATL